MGKESTESSGDVDMETGETLRSLRRSGNGSIHTNSVVNWQELRATGVITVDKSKRFSVFIWEGMRCVGVRSSIRWWKESELVGIR